MLLRDDARVVLIECSSSARVLRDAAPHQHDGARNDRDHHDQTDVSHALPPTLLLPRAAVITASSGHHRAVYRCSEPPPATERERYVRIAVLGYSPRWSRGVRR